MKKLKIAILCDNMTINGISKVVENYALSLDKNQFSLVILGAEPVAKYYDYIYAKNKIKLIHLPDKHKEPIKYYIHLYKELASKEYDIFHVHGNSANAVVQLALGKMAGISSRIMHCHNTRCDHPFMTKIMRPFFNHYCTDGFACGYDAGKWLWSKNNFTVIPNAFRTERFVYDESEREKIRKELSLEDKIILGHLGRINDQKNQLFLLDIFENIASKSDKYALLLVGTGPYLDLVKDKINKSKYKKRIKLYGEVTKPEKIYSAMDMFAFPSKYEGLPVVLLEAQISGLKCFVSDRVTKEMDFGDITYITIDSGTDVWSNSILESSCLSNRRMYAIDKNQYIKNYDIEHSAKKLEELYKCIYKKNQRRN